MSDHPYAYSSAASPSVRKAKFRKRVAAVLIVAAASLAAFGSLRIASGIAKDGRHRRLAASEFEALWRTGDYAAVEKASAEALAAYPLEPIPLVFKGLSAFYLGIAETDAGARTAKMDEAVFALRKALIDDKAPLRAETLYVLGKAYFHKGADYYGEAIECVRGGMDAGYRAKDAWEYLALASQGLGLAADSVAYFEKALEAAPESAELSLAAGMANAAAGRAGEAERLVKAALEGTGDEYLAERCAFALGELYVASSRFDEALEMYGTVKEKNPQSADAWYYEGVALEAKGDPIKARAAWRKAVSIDPMHSGARQKLSERS